MEKAKSKQDASYDIVGIERLNDTELATGTLDMSLEECQQTAAKPIATKASNSTIDNILLRKLIPALLELEGTPPPRNPLL